MFTSCGFTAAPAGARRRHDRCGQRRARAFAVIATPDRSRSSPSSCDPRRGSDRAMSPARSRASECGTTRRGRPSAYRATRSPVSAQRCPWTWNVWKSEPSAITSHCTSSPTFAWKTGVLPTKARPSIVMNLPIGARTTWNSRSGARSSASEDREHPEHPSADRVDHRRRVVVIGPDAGRVLAGRQPVRVGLARFHVRVLAREAGDERAVGARCVVHPVEVHRVRLAAQRVHVLEVDPQVVAHPRPDQWPGDHEPVGARPRGVRERLLPARRSTGGRRRSGSPCPRVGRPCP